MRAALQRGESVLDRRVSLRRRGGGAVACDLLAARERGVGVLLLRAGVDDGVGDERAARRPVTVSLTGARGLSNASYPGALAQVVTNLVMNSLTHAFAEGEAGAIQIRLVEAEGGLELEYADDGCGIPRESLAKIFEPFFTTQRGRGGIGLGLHVVHNLVTQRMGGTIRCESEPGQGARFYISLPAATTR